MSYGVMADQEAFGLLSLLGEVGGFLGLLLGASVITLCELLDYILLKVVARCSCCHQKEELQTVKVEKTVQDTELIKGVTTRVKF